MKSAKNATTKSRRGRPPEGAKARINARVPPEVKSLLSEAVRLIRPIAKDHPQLAEWVRAHGWTAELGMLAAFGKGVMEGSIDPKKKR
jgi:hypothetical protein